MSAGRPIRTVAAAVRGGARGVEWPYVRGLRATGVASSLDPNEPRSRCGPATCAGPPPHRNQGRPSPDTRTPGAAVPTLERGSQMSTDQTDSVVPVVVLELLERSETIQGWMGRLADHADEAYPEVLQRVKEDYRGRLEEVAGQLAQHRPQLATKLEDRQGTVVSLRFDRNSQVADLEEARLRHAVGEFSEPEWDSRRTKIEGLLDEVDSLLEVEEGAVSEITEALERIDASGPRRTSLAFTSEGYVEVEHAPPMSRDGVRNGSWSAVLSEMKKEGDSVVAGRIPTAENPAGNGPAAGDGSDDSDELDFIDAVSTDDLEELDSIAAAMRAGEA